MLCRISGCGREDYCAGLCSTHYNRLRTTGTTDPGPRARLPLAERFWAKVDHRGPNECWPWTGKSKNGGYGYIGLTGVSGGHLLSNRAAWMLTNGEIPKGLVIRHTCHNRLCCNPAHLVPGTRADNVSDMWANKGGPRGNAKLTEEQIAAIRADKRGSRKLAPLYGVHDAHIRSIRSKRVWKNI